MKFPVDPIIHERYRMFATYLGLAGSFMNGFMFLHVHTSPLCKKVRVATQEITGRPENLAVDPIILWR